MGKRSEELFEEAKKYIPGGVNSPVRAFRAVGANPLFIEKAQGAYLYDVDGGKYTDYIGSWGPMIVGHAHPEVLEAVRAAMERGSSYGAPTEVEVEMAKQVVQAFPAMEMVRMVSSGTEATMSAIRLARAYTNRDKIIKFSGCYHGHADNLLAKAGSGVTTLGLPDSPGVPGDLAKNTLTVDYNNLEAIEKIIQDNPEQIACVILEAVPANMGVVLPREGFLQSLRKLTQQHGILLIFDEVITGFRLGYSGAQGYFDIEPDLTCLGKIIGGGFPVGAYGGKREIMEQIAPAGPVYQAGTLSGNPVAMTAGIKTLEILRRPGVYDDLREKAEYLREGLAKNVREVGLAVYLTGIESMSCLFFTDQEVVDYETAKTADTAKYGAFFRSMLAQGVYLAPAQFEAMFVSLAHSWKDIDDTVKASLEALKYVKSLG